MDMIEIIAIISTILAMYWGFSSASRDTKEDTIQDATALATIISELEAVQVNINDLKVEIREEIKKPLHNYSERLIIVEANNNKIESDIIKIINDIKDFENSIKRVHNRIDGISDNSVNLKKG